MYLPPEQAWQPETKSTHAALRNLLVERATQVRDSAADASRVDAQLRDIALPTGCGLGVPYTPSVVTVSETAEEPDRSYLRSSSGAAALPLTDSTIVGCSAGAIYCWATCMTVADYNLNCSYTEVTCVDGSGNPTDPSKHDGANKPGCMGMASDPGGFCQGNGVDMYMTGFVSYVTGKYRTAGGSTTPACISLWFEDWVLDTKGTLCCYCEALYRRFGSVFGVAKAVRIGLLSLAVVSLSGIITYRMLFSYRQVHGGLLRRVPAGHLDGGPLAPAAPSPFAVPSLRPPHADVHHVPAVRGAADVRVLLHARGDDLPGGTVRVRGAGPRRGARGVQLQGGAGAAGGQAERGGEDPARGGGPGRRGGPLLPVPEPG
jgi:hypothetical protein